MRSGKEPRPSRKEVKSLRSIEGPKENHGKQTSRKTRIFHCNLSKFTTESRRLPSFLSYLIIGIRIVHDSLSKLGSVNENRRSDKEAHPSRILFINSNKRLKITMPLEPNTFEMTILG
jgi:hypothetical protein